MDATDTTRDLLPLELDNRAREICEAARGAGAFDRKHAKKDHWRALARLEHLLGPEDFAKLRGNGRGAERMLLRHVEQERSRAVATLPSDFPERVTAARAECEDALNGQAVSLIAAIDNLKYQKALNSSLSVVTFTSGPLPLSRWQRLKQWLEARF